MVSVSLSGGSIYVHCTFINKLPTNSCYVILLETYNDYYSTTLVTTGVKVFSDLQPGQYVIFVYGVEGEYDFTLSHTHNFHTALRVVSTAAAAIPDDIASGSASAKEKIMLLGVKIVKVGDQ